MGLRKLLSTNTTTTTAEEKKVSRKSASSISLSKSISNWAGKEKEKLKQHSLNSKRHSQPSPTQSHGSVHSHAGRKTNPFEEEETEPVTPTSGSLRDGHDVVTKRMSDSFMEDRRSDDMQPVQTTEEDGYVSSPMTYDSNKHEVASVDSTNDRKEIDAELETVAVQLQTMNPENAVEIKERMKQVNTVLKVAMERSQVLEEKIQVVATKSKQIIEASVEETRALKEQLKLKVEHEANAHAMLLKTLDEQQEKVRAEKEGLEQEKCRLVQENERMEARYDRVLGELKEKEKAWMQKEQALKGLEEREKLRVREHELEMLKVREEEGFKEKDALIKEHEEKYQAVLNQLQETKEALEKKEMDRLREQEELKMEKVELIKDHEERYQMALNRLEETQSALEKKEKEMALTKEKIYMLFNQEIRNDDELIDGIKAMMIRIEGLEQEAERKKEEANQREQAYSALIQEKIKLENGTEEIRDLLDKEHNRFVEQRKENEALKIKLTELEEQQEEADTMKERIEQLEKKGLQQSPEDMVQLHAKAQLGLIEYLEGEDDVTQAITKFKKQLETNLKEFNSTNPNLDKHR